jgi:uncharacterized membrane protein YcaP (DUF421 family)
LTNTQGKKVLSQWIWTSWSDLAMVLLGGVATYTAVIVYTRIMGLRSFSKMSAPDFAMTVAVGSLFASTMSTSKPPLLLGLFALFILFLGQWMVAFFRRRFDHFEQWTDNNPVLLMQNGELIHENMRTCQVTENDLLAKLREANVLNFQHVRAIVFETTGDISVLHSDNPEVDIEPRLLKNVVDADRLTNPPRQT